MRVQQAAPAAVAAGLGGRREKLLQHRTASGDVCDTISVLVSELLHPWFFIQLFVFFVVQQPSVSLHKSVFVTFIRSKSQLWRKRTLTWSCAFTSWRSACSRSVMTPLRTYLKRYYIYFCMHLCSPSVLNVACDSVIPTGIKWDHNFSLDNSWVLFNHNPTFMILEQPPCLFIVAFLREL